MVDRQALRVRCGNLSNNICHLTHIVLVRHGQASFGAANYDQLSETGKRQPEVLAAHWGQAGQRPVFDAVYAGSMQRQQHTARLTLPQAALKTDAAFNEYDFEGILRNYFPLVAREHPELKMERRELFGNPKAFQRVFEIGIGYWLAGRAPDQPVESWKDFCARVEAGLKRVAAESAERVVVFTSGGVIAVALRHALGLTDEMAMRLNWRIYNASVHSFKMGRSGLSLLGYNNVTHLELANDPTLLTFR